MPKNPWIQFLQQFRKSSKGKGKSMKTSMKEAAVLWRKQKGSGGKSKAKKKKAEFGRVNST